MFQNIVQAACTERVSRSGRLDRARLYKCRLFCSAAAAVCPASPASHRQQNQGDVIFPPKLIHSTVEILLAGKPPDLVVRYFQHIAHFHPVSCLSLRLFHGLPERFPYVRIKGEQRPVCLCGLNGMSCGASHRLIRHRERAKMKYAGIL